MVTQCATISAWGQAESKEGLLGQSIEVLTVEEFADRMKISRTTVFDWMKHGRLKEGRHYIKVGRIIRFEWGPELLKMLHEDSAQAEVAVQPALPRQPMARERKRPRNKNTTINFDY